MVRAPLPLRRRSPSVRINSATTMARRLLSVFVLRLTGEATGVDLHTPRELPQLGDTPGDDPTAAFQVYGDRVKLWHEAGGHSELGSVCGEGSMEVHTRDFVNFLLPWLEKHGITSMVEASSGHWPSGWQRTVRWPRIKYQGIDITRQIVDDNRELGNRMGPDAFGLASLRFDHADMVRHRLPSADLLLTKDTLQHLPNAAIAEFLRRNVVTCPPLFKYVMFVEARPRMERYRQHHVNNDIRYHETRCVDIGRPPFNLSVKNVFKWSMYIGYWDVKHVQVFEPGAAC
eukprot:TRINITY_DN35160_c0_g1_i1.p1 TRINITY_DN35160_c0_g1~~TRINITY_DN35160_c0_g1_i1.p1  ORF type:complete len:287 (+),score=45.14 TRINITY_DN35160_c0_g1_i1:48-908(+)